MNFNNDIVASSLFGEQSSENLLILAPGTLYDTERPPEHCILRSLREKLANKALSLMVNRTKQSGNDIYEIPPSEQSMRIEAALDIVLPKLNINSISYVSHSTGALTLGCLYDKYRISNNLLLTPPSPFNSALEQIKRCTYNLMPVNVEASRPSQIAYRSREGFDYYFSDDVWYDIKMLEPVFYDFCKKSSSTEIFLASNDKVFPFSDDDKKQLHNYTEVEDTHSLRKLSSLNLISNYVISKMLI